MAFKIRRVTSGLLPQQHISSSFKDHSAQVAKTIANNGLTQLTHDDSKPPAWTLLGDGSLDPTHNGFESIDTRFVARPHIASSADDIQRTKSTTHHNSKHPRREPSLSTDAEFIRQHKLISDSNVFSPSMPAGRMGLTLKKAPFDLRLEDLEFDPSDRDLPEKHPRQIEAEDKKLQQVSNLGPTTTYNVPKSLVLDQPVKATYTPRRSSPLRQILAKDSANTSTEEVIHLISESSALRPRTSKEIADQIHSSVERMRVIENVRSDSDVPATRFEDSDMKILQSLDVLLPPRSNTLEDGSKLVSNASHQKENIVLELGSPIQSRKFRTQKTSRKNTRDEINNGRNKRQRIQSKDWSQGQWGTLRKLVQLPIPDNAIINSKAVRRRLGCMNKKELTQRVQFLKNQLQK